MDIQNAYTEKAEAQLKQAEAQVKIWEAQAEKADAEEKVDLLEKIESVRYQQDGVEEKLAQLKQASTEAWDDMRTGFEKAWKDLSHAFQKAKQSFDA